MEAYFSKRMNADARNVVCLVCDHLPAFELQSSNPAKAIQNIILKLNRPVETLDIIAQVIHSDYDISSGNQIVAAIQQSIRPAAFLSFDLPAAVASLRKEQVDRDTAVSMALHQRLGIHAGLSVLGADLLALVVLNVLMGN